MIWVGMIQIGEKAAALDTPLEHLVACHRRIEDRLATLERAAGELRTDPETSLAAIGACLNFMDSNGALHTEDEEISLFPRLRPRLSSNELAYVDALEHQHREADSIYSELKGQVARLKNLGGAASVEETHAYRELAGKLREIYREHIRSEEEVLLRLARRSLNEGELREISGEMKQRRTGLPKAQLKRTPCLTV